MINSLQGLFLDNRYKIIEKIGVGGMADVYKGEDTLLGRPVAIKVLHQNFAGDEEFVTRFRREAQAAGKLNHPNVVNMYDVGVDQGLHYIIMEYVEGETLKTYITKHAPLSVDHAVKFTIAIAEGLEHAHAMGIVHCDIKPHNVLITKGGRVKVTDFGIARAINSGTTMMYTNSIMGSAHYLSPEQAKGCSVTGSTDIYSLGVVLYEMLTGKVPYEGDTPISVALKHVNEKLTTPTLLNPSIPPLLESVVMRALAKKPEDRFRSITEMIQELRLSQGLVGNKSNRLSSHDFATQVLPSVSEMETTRYGDVDTVDETEEQKTGFLTRLAQLPQKYIVIGSICIFILAFLWAFLSFGNFWSNASVNVPNVVGKQVSVAKQLLEDDHLRVSINEITSDKVPAGQVISQTPEAGQSVKEQRTITLVVSKGVGNISVPDLTGLTLDQARDKLYALNLSIGSISAGSDSNKPDGVVISQTPPSDSHVSDGATVNLVINDYKPKTMTLPNFKGQKLSDVKTELKTLQLGLGSITGDSSDDAIVQEQNPAAGTSVKEGTSIDFLTSKVNEQKQRNDNTRSGTVTVNVPAGPAQQQVKIVVVDDNGTHVIYAGTRKPGDVVSRDISGHGSATVQVFIEGKLIREQSL